MTIPAVNEATVGATQVVDNDSQVMEMDDATHAVNVLDHTHHEIHEGDSFFFGAGFQLNNAAREYLITTPNTTKWAHMLLEVSGAQDTSMALIEDTQKTGGTTQTVFNHNRNSATAAGVGIHLTPSGAHGTGVTITTQQWGVATQGAGRGSGQENRSEHEIILKQNAKYALIVTALSANPNNISVHMTWYEHTNK